MKKSKKIICHNVPLNMEKDQIKAIPLSGGLFVLDVECEGMQEPSFVVKRHSCDLTWEQLNGLS